MVTTKNNLDFQNLSAEEIQNHPDFESLNLTINEINQKKHLLLKALETNQKCLNSKYKCAYEGEHVLFKRDTSYHRPRLVYEVFACQKLKNWDKLSHSFQDKMFHKMIGVHQIPKSNYRDCLLTFKKLIDQTNDFTQKVNTLTLEIKHMGENKLQNLFLHFQTPKLTDNYLVLKILWCCFFKFVKNKNFTINLLDIKKVLTYEKYNIFKKDDENTELADKIYNIPVLIINNFDDAFVTLNDHINYVNALIVTRSIKKLQTVIVSSHSWSQIKKNLTVELKQKNGKHSIEDLNKVNATYKDLFKYL